MSNSPSETDLDQTDFTNIDLLGMFEDKSPRDFYDVTLTERRVAVLSLLEPASEATGVNADTLRGMWWVESRSGHPDMLVSPTNAKGDWQFTKETQANMFLHYGPEIADNLEEYGFTLEAENVRMFTRGLRNLAIEEHDIETGTLNLEASESNELFRNVGLSWRNDIVPAANRGFFNDPESYENIDEGSAILQGYNQLMPSEMNFLERMDRTRLDLPATMTFTAAFYMKEIAEDAGVDAGDYNNAGSLYAGYNIGPGNAARLSNDLSDNSNAMGSIGSAAQRNPYFFRNNATGEEALENYQEAVDGWRNFQLYELEPSQNLVEGIARGLRDENDLTVNPYDVYSNVMEDRGYYDRAETLQAVRENPLLYPNPFQYTNGISLPFTYSTDITAPFSFDPIPHIDPQNFRLSQAEKELLLVDIPTPDEEEFLPIPK